MTKPIVHTLKRDVSLRNQRRRVGCSESKPSPSYSPPIKNFPVLEEVEVESDTERVEEEYCQNWGPSISYHIEQEKKMADLEEKLKQAKAEANSWFLRAEQLESNLQTLLLQNENATIAQNCIEGFGDSDEVTSQCSSNGQSGIDKWACRLCEEYEVSVVVLPCNHLSLCFDCSFDADTCPVCGATNAECIFVRSS